MSIENNGTTNGAPKGKNNTSLTMLVGDFLKMLSQENYLENQEKREVSSYVFNSLRENDPMLSVGLEANNNRDIIFLEFIEKNPQFEKAKMTREEWDKLLVDYMNKKNASEINKD